ncbi:MAG: FAD:protein FMN transferase, partial [Spirochaetales bacterium]|nr:FAD:protein FMN transferase [Spirochaetales bacterium]
MDKIKSIKKSLFLMFFIIFFISGCAKSFQDQGTAAQVEPESRSELMLGTVSRITLYDGISDKAFDSAFKRIEQIESEMSVNIRESEISSINAAAGSEEPTRVSQDTFSVIQESLHIAQVSGGAFDPSIGPLVALWGIGTDNARIPEPSEIAEALE